MSNPVSALQGKATAEAVTVREAGLRGMISLRGDLASSKLKAVCTSLTGVEFPAPNRAHVAGDKGLAWMSRDEVLVMVPYADAGEALAKIGKALAGQHHLAVNVSDARAVIDVTGTHAREIIAKLAPVDLHPVAFHVGDFRRSRLGQVAAAFWLQAEGHVTVVCFRSVAAYTFDLLAASAQAGAVGHYPD